jgi:hypothetical protein
MRRSRALAIVTLPWEPCQRSCGAASAMLILRVAGCAPLHCQVPAYPAQNQTVDQIGTDIVACERWAEDVTPEPGGSAATLHSRAVTRQFHEDQALERVLR